MNLVVEHLHPQSSRLSPQYHNSQISEPELHGTDALSVRVSLSPLSASARLKD